MKKKIALIGNMNNNFFAITRHLRDLGYDAHLFYRVGMEHFQPKADTYTLNYEEYCHQVDWLDKGFHNVNEQNIKQTLSGYDFYIGQGEEAAVAFRCGFRMNVYYTYGSDVTKYSYLPQEFSFTDKVLSQLRRYKKTKVTIAQMKQGTLAKYQRGVIVNAHYILAEYTNKDFTEKLNGLNFIGKYERVPMPFIYLEEYDQLNKGYLPDVHWRSEIDTLRADNDFLLLYHGRQEWKGHYNEFNGKNTHHIIIGFADHLKRYPDRKMKLVMVEYGNDVKYSKELVQELGIQQHVKWFPKMYRKDLMYLIKNMDVCSGEFARSYLTFGTIVEAMLMRKPVIHYREDGLYTDIYRELYPLMNAKQPEEIAQAIDFAYNNREVISKMGDDSYEWIKTHFIKNPVLFLQRLIESK